MNIITLEKWLPHTERAAPPNLVVLHATMGATARSSIDWLRGQGFSYHYIIARDNKDTAKSENANGTEPIIFRCVPNEGHAFHVASTIPVPSRKHSINNNSIGISLANIQRIQNPEPYTQKQLLVLETLIKQLKTELPTLQYLTTHAAVQPWNRRDPLGVNGKQIAQAVGLKWWQPTEAEIVAHTPKKTRVA